jgi:Zn-dependent protease
MLAQMNLGLAVFNLIPVPPLDGYRFLDMFVFKGRLALERQTMNIIQIVFLAICISGVLSRALTVVNGAVYGFLSNLFSVLV